jgi:cytochrome d ubiquinol oxidase subunit I
MAFSLTGFVLLYTTFIVIEMYLMVRAVRQGPDAHKPAPDEPLGHMAQAASRRAA